MLSAAYRLFYSLGRGLRGMGQSPLVTFIGVITIAVCMLLLGVAMLALNNARAVNHAWGIDIPITVYLNDSATQDEALVLARRIESVGGVTSVRVIGADEAYTRLLDGLGGQAGAGLGVDLEALPTSLEIEIEPRLGTAFVEALRGELERYPIVEEVACLGPWIGSAKTVLSTLEYIAGGLALLVGFACTSIVWSTIRLGVHHRRTEIEILQLMGATRGFIHAPFVVEGLLQGIAGATVAASLLYLGYIAVAPAIDRALALLLAGPRVEFFGFIELAIGVALAAVWGMVGSRIAVSRYGQL